MKKYILFAGLVMSVCGAASADASEVYSYVGNYYTSTYGGYFYSSSPSCSGVSCDFVTISFTVSSPLGDNFSGVVTPTSFTVSDGVDTITSANAYIGTINSDFSSPYFDIATNASGQISKWAIALAYTNLAPFSATIVSISGISEPGYSPSIDIADVWNYCTLPNCGEETYAGQGYIPGVWSNAQVGATPLPAALPLFATGLGAMGLLGWRRKRKAAAIAA